MADYQYPWDEEGGQRTEDYYGEATPETGAAKDVGPESAFARAKGPGANAGQMQDTVTFGQQGKAKGGGAGTESTFHGQPYQLPVPQAGAVRGAGNPWTALTRPPGEAKAMPPIPFTQADNLRLQRLNQGMSEVQGQVDDGTLHPTEADTLLKTIQQMQQPLQMKQQQAKQQAQMEQQQQLMHASALQESIEAHHQITRAKAFPQSVASFADPLTGAVEHFYQDERGKFKPIEFARHEAQRDREADQEPVAPPDEARNRVWVDEHGEVHENASPDGLEEGPNAMPDVGHDAVPDRLGPQWMERPLGEGREVKGPEEGDAEEPKPGGLAGEFLKAKEAAGNLQGPPEPTDAEKGWIDNPDKGEVGGPSAPEKAAYPNLGPGVGPRKGPWQVVPNPAKPGTFMWQNTDQMKAQQARQAQHPPGAVGSAGQMARQHLADAGIFPPRRPQVMTRESINWWNHATHDYQNKLAMQMDHILKNQGITDRFGQRLDQQGNQFVTREQRLKEAQAVNEEGRNVRNDKRLDAAEARAKELHATTLKEKEAEQRRKDEEQGNKLFGHIHDKLVQDAEAERKKRIDMGEPPDKVAPVDEAKLHKLAKERFLQRHGQSYAHILWPEEFEKGGKAKQKIEPMDKGWNPTDNAAAFNEQVKKLGPGGFKKLPEADQQKVRDDAKKHGIILPGG